jgi:hypothetical protein
LRVGKLATKLHGGSLALDPVPDSYNGSRRLQLEKLAQGLPPQTPIGTGDENRLVAKVD